MGECVVVWSSQLGVRAAGAVLPLMALAGPMPPTHEIASFAPMWSSGSRVYVTGKVRCEGSDTPTWVWLRTGSGESGWAGVWSQRDNAAQFGRHFDHVPSGGTTVSASWACGYDDDRYSTTFRLSRPWWGVTATVNLCPWRPCWA